MKKAKVYVIGSELLKLLV